MQCPRAMGPVQRDLDSLEQWAARKEHGALQQGEVQSPAAGEGQTQALLYAGKQLGSGTKDTSLETRKQCAVAVCEANGALGYTEQ